LILGALPAKLFISIATSIICLTNMTLLEVLLLKILYKTRWSMMAGICDDFLSAWIGRFNCLWTAFWVASRWICHDFGIGQHYEYFSGITGFFFVDPIVEKFFTL